MGTALVGGVCLVAGIATHAEEARSPRSTEALVFNCFTCHGPEAHSPASMPTLNGKPATYILRRLREFREGRGSPIIMDRIAKGYTDDELTRIADYLSKLP